MNASGDHRPGNALTDDLCRACGLCCNGVIFADVRLEAGDAPARLRALGLSLMGVGEPAAGGTKNGGKSPAPRARLTQPCAAWEGCRCRIYAERPSYCREFECLLLKSARAGRTGRGEALTLIGNARERAGEVTRLLNELGDQDQDLPLARRFHRVSKRLERAGLNEQTAALYGRLTLAMHDLNLQLASTFYPGSRSSI